MLVSGGQGIMRLEVTYRVSRIAHVVHFCCVRCSLFQAANRSVVPLFLSLCHLRHYDSQANQQQPSSGSFFY